MQWLRKSFRNKILIMLLLIGIVPPILLGGVTNYLIQSVLERDVSAAAQQSIENLSTNISMEMHFLHSLLLENTKNYRIIAALGEPQPGADAQERVFKLLQSELLYSSSSLKVNYPYSYMAVAVDGTLYSSYSHSGYTDYSRQLELLLSSAWFRQLQKTSIPSIWTGIGPNILLSGNRGQQLMIASNVLRNAETVGVIILCMDIRRFEKQLEMAKLDAGNGTYVINAEGQCLFAGENNPYSFAAVPAAALAGLQPGQGGYRSSIQGTGHMLLGSTIQFVDTGQPWRLILTIPLSSFQKDASAVINITLLLIAVIVLAAVAFIVIIHRIAVKPILEYSNVLHEVKRDNLHVRATVRSGDEIGVLGEGINDMLGRINRLVGEIREEAEEKRLLELEMLQAQINPHFIRNTLNSLGITADLNHAPMLSKSINIFNKMLNYLFEDFGDSVELRRELDYLQEYIYLQNLRYQNKYTLYVAVDPELLNTPVSKLTLQPVVENCIIHGFGGKKGICRIDIRCRREGARRIIEVLDNGWGLPPGSTAGEIPTESNADSAKHMVKLHGIANVHRRLHLVHGADYGLEIENRSGGGVCVRISLPGELVEAMP